MGNCCIVDFSIPILERQKSRKKVIESSAEEGEYMEKKQWDF